jgi:hypothetical protein
MELTKLPISIGMLSWHSTDVLINTLTSYYENRLLDFTDDFVIFFQEFNEDDKKIAEHFGVSYIPSPSNIGIGQAFVELAKQAKYENLLILEHDWELIESTENTYNRLHSALELLKQGYKQIKLRHRKQPGVPLFSERAYKGKELEHYDKEIDLISPNLLSCIHWTENPEDIFKQINKQGEYFITTSRWSNWTNNPCLLKTKSYLEYVPPFAGKGIELEGKISYWWARQDFPVAHGEGLFMHNDFKKYNR